MADSFFIVVLVLFLAFVIFAIIRHKETERSFVVPYLGKLTWIPFVGSYLQSLSARADLEAREKKRAALTDDEQRNTARNRRKLLSRVQRGNRHPQTQPRKHVYDREYPTAENAREKERALKSAIAMSTSSHSRVSRSAPPSNLSVKTLKQLAFFTYRFQSDERYREPFLLERMDTVAKTVEQVDLSRFAKELRGLTVTASINFLYGSIGSGKSTAAAIIEAETYRQITSATSDLRVQIISLDFEEIVHDLRSSGRKRKEIFVEHVFERLKSKNLRRVYEGSLEEHLNSAIGQKYVFIFDNLDVLYSEFCRYFVADRDMKLTFFGHNSYLYCLRELIRVFSQLTTFNSPTAPSVLLCLREDTISLLDALYLKAGEPSLFMQFHVVRLLAPEAPEYHFTSLIRKRLLLAQDMLNSPGIPSDIHAAMSSIAEHIAITPQNYSDFVNLSVQGNRSAIQAFHRYFLAAADIEQISHAMSDPNRVKCLALFNGHESYAQERANIANLFLVNSEYRVASAHPDLPIDLELPDYFHHHTYWLKYLVLGFIYSRNTSLGSADLLEVEKLFCDLGGFDRRLVRLVVYSLTEVQHGRLVRPRISNAHLNERFLHMTSRGRQFAKDNFRVAWSFPYLATIIEDEWMELPKFMAEEYEEFGSRAFWKVEDYHAYLLDKVGAVTDMVYCLEQALEFERILRPKLFQILNDDGITAYCIPNFDERAETLQTYALEAAAWLSDDSFNAKLKERVKSVKKRKDAQKVRIRAQLSPMYDYPEF